MSHIIPKAVLNIESIVIQKSHIYYHKNKQIIEKMFIIYLFLTSFYY